MVREHAHDLKSLWCCILCTCLDTRRQTRPIQNGRATGDQPIRDPHWANKYQTYTHIYINNTPAYIKSIYVYIFLCYRNTTKTPSPSVALNAPSQWRYSTRSTLSFIWECSSPENLFEVQVDPLPLLWLSILTFFFFSSIHWKRPFWHKD